MRLFFNFFYIHKLCIFFTTFYMKYKTKKNKMFKCKFFNNLFNFHYLKLNPNVNPPPYPSPPLEGPP